MPYDSDFTLDALHFEVPPHLVAHHPAAARTQARMLAVNRATSELEDQVIADLPKHVSAGDVLVVNDTRVLPARFLATRATGGRIEGLFLGEEISGRWRAMLTSSGRLREGETLLAGSTKRTVPLKLVARLPDGEWLIEPDGESPVAELLAKIGTTPLPPYIKRDAAEPEDESRYQTVYARAPGAVAAPTAGLHLTDELLAEIRAKGVEVVAVTLHVGAGTFKPIRAARLEDHEMHTEAYALPSSASEAIVRCRQRGGRVIAVGTTTVRVLETCARIDGTRSVEAGSGETNLLIYPPYAFRVVDALLTNFHWPHTTLLALVMAFTGVRRTRDAYAHALANGYRLFSYGDAMLIHGDQTGDDS